MEQVTKVETDHTQPCKCTCTSLLFPSSGLDRSSNHKFINGAENSGGIYFSALAVCECRHLKSFWTKGGDLQTAIPGPSEHEPRSLRKI